MLGQLSTADNTLASILAADQATATSVTTGGGAGLFQGAAGFLDTLDADFNNTVSVTQTEVLIPMGSKLHGSQGGRQALNQNDQSLIVRWDDIEFPNGGHVRLADMPGADPSGYPGFEDLVDNHYARTWTPAVLISAITAGSMLASNPTYGSAGGYNVTQEALGAGASRMGTFGREQLMSQLINNKPTLIIRPGYQFRVLITRDLVFSQPYASAQ